jgi:cobalt/nickel transport system permease protein
MRFGVLLAVGLAVALALALVVSPHASSEPDGLNKVAADEGFAADAEPHALADLPTAGYGTSDGHQRMSPGLAGALGVAITFAVAGGLLLVVRRRSWPTPTAFVRPEPTPSSRTGRKSDVGR